MTPPFDVAVYNADDEELAVIEVEAESAIDAYLTAAPSLPCLNEILEDTPVTWQAVPTEVPPEPPASFDTSSGHVLPEDICTDWDV